MKINELNISPSFGKVIIGDSKPSKKQAKIIKKVLKHPALTPKLVKDLENLSTDIYIIPRSYSNSVSLKLYTDIGFFGTKIVPYEGRYNTQVKTSLNPDFQDEILINMSISNFLKRAGELDFGSDKNLKLVERAMQNPIQAEKIS